MQDVHVDVPVTVEISRVEKREGRSALGGFDNVTVWGERAAFLAAHRLLG